MFEELSDSELDDLLDKFDAEIDYSNNDIWVTVLSNPRPYPEQPYDDTRIIQHDWHTFSFTTISGNETLTHFQEEPFRLSTPHDPYTIDMNETITERQYLQVSGDPTDPPEELLDWLENACNDRGFNAESLTADLLDELDTLNADSALFIGERLKPQTPP